MSLETSDDDDDEEDVCVIHRVRMKLKAPVVSRLNSGHIEFYWSSSTGQIQLLRLFTCSTLKNKDNNKSRYCRN